MAFNGSGLFARLYSFVNDAANSINIRADRMDAEMDGIASGLSNCITRDGQGKPSAGIDWNGQNLSNVGALTATSGAFTGAVNGAAGTFSGAVSGTTGTFSGAVTIGAAPGAADSSSKAPTTAWVGANTPGRLLNVQIFSASGTYTPTAGATSAVVEVLGAGGGGGSAAQTGAGQISGASGGGAGGYAVKRIASLTAQTVTVGAAGSGGNSGAFGVAGGSSSFGAIVSATGGAGGSSGGGGAFGNGVGTTGGTGIAGDVNAPGGIGTGPWGIGSVPIVRSGAGGTSRYGSGGDLVTTFATGNSGVGYGAGGGGGACPPSSAGAASGGPGTSGLVIVWEYL